MKCYIINLDRSVDRMQFMLDQFSYLERQLYKGNIEVIRMPAIDAGKLSDDEVEACYDKGFYSFNARYFPHIVSAEGLSKVEIACFLSHRACWKRIAESEDSYGAVFEDDVFFSSESAFFLADDKWIPNGTDIVKFEVMTRKLIVDWLRRQYFRKRQIVRFYTVNIGTAAYVISRQAAVRLLELTKTFYLPVDHVMFDNLFPYFCSLKCYQVVPALCIQDSELNGGQATYKSTLDNGDQSTLLRCYSKERPNFEIRLVRELKRIFYQLKSRAGLRKKIINWFPVDEGFACRQKKTDMSN